MSEEKHHHHLFHHKKEDDAPSEVVYGESTTTYGDEEVIQTTDVYAAGNVQSDDYEKALKEEKHHKRMEHLGELGTAAAGAFALHEKHAEKKDPEHAHRHKIEEEIAAAAAVGAGGYVFHEHHEKKESKEEAKEIDGYSGDVWFPQPAPKDHPWRYMPNHAMTPHISRTTIDAQIRYAAGTKDMLDKYFRGEYFPSQNYIVKEGTIANQYL